MKGGTNDIESLRTAEDDGENEDARQSFGFFAATCMYSKRTDTLSALLDHTFITHVYCTFELHVHVCMHAIA